VNASLSGVDQAKNTVVDLAIRFGPRLLTAALIVVLGVLASRWVGRWLLKALARLELEPPVRQLLARVAMILTLALFLIVALQNLGVELLPLIAGLSVIGAGVALATQGVLSNVVAGLSIIFSKPFRVGEYIALVGVEGTVDQIGLFSTVLGHPDRSRVVIPNRKIVGEILHNYGKIRQLAVDVGVAYDTDLEAALAIIDGVLTANARVLRDPAPLVRTTTLGKYSVIIAVQPWVSVTDYMIASGELNRAILEAFRARGIVMPVPQSEIRLLRET
jgi:small conductance mechanosensitive channel